MGSNYYLREVIRGELSRIGSVPIYLTKYGSELYGLNTENSDEDYVCVFLPPKKKLIMNGFVDFQHTFSYQTKKDPNEKNSPEDIDVKFISLQKFLRKLVSLEVEACDILYSYTNKETIKLENGFDILFKNRHRLMDITNKEAFIGYGINQVKKYGLKGTAVGIAKNILKYLEKFNVVLAGAKLKDIIRDLIHDNYLPKDKRRDIWDLVKIPVGDKNGNITPALKLFNSFHTLNISVKEFHNRIQGFYGKYGERAKLAEKNHGIDWKAASHGLRSIINYTKLIKRGDYSYPFTGNDKEVLMKIKLGQMTWENYESIFDFRMSILNSLEPPICNLDLDFVEEFIEKFY